MLISFYRKFSPENPTWRKDSLSRPTPVRPQPFFLTFAILLLVFTGILTASAEPAKKIIVLESMPVPVVKDYSNSFTAKLRSIYPEAAIDIQILEAEGDRETAIRLLLEAVAFTPPDLVVPVATLATQSAVEVLRFTGIPVFFLCVSDPVGAGIIEEEGRATGTGVTGRIHSISREVKIDNVMRLIGGTFKNRPVRVGYIHSSYPSSVGDLEKLTSLAQQRTDLVFVPYRVEYSQMPAGLDGMMEQTVRGIQDLEDRVDCWWEPLGPLGEIREYTQALIRHSKHPIVMGTAEKSVQEGALFHLTPSLRTAAEEGALIARTILEGTDPGTIPVAPPSSFDLGINLTTAVKYNFVIPAELLELAEGHIYR
jgi:putative ABC transport system substrate-binding protein